VYPLLTLLGRLGFFSPNLLKIPQLQSRKDTANFPMIIKRVFLEETSF
jgi:hypothetical protein